MKKLNKLVAILVALAMMATLCVVSAFAADPVTTYPAANAKLAKYLQAGTGVDKPGATYNFVVTPTNGGPTATKTSLTATEMAPDANGDYYGSFSIADMFEGKTWPSTGEYTYTISEGAVTAYDENSDPNDTLTIDSNTNYKLRVYVQSVNNVNTITGVTVAKVTTATETYYELDGEEVPEGTEGAEAKTREVTNEAKVDPTNPPAVADDGQGKGFSFTNVYQKNLVDPDKDNDEQDKTGVLDVTKNVTGNYGDKVNKFPFELEYTLPAANQGTITYKVIPAATTDAEDIAAIEEQTAEDGKITFALAHGDKLIITQAPQGTKWFVTEKLASAPVQNVDSYLASSDKYMPTPAPTEGNNLKTVEQTLSAADAITVTNAFDDNDVTPTGILINNLPYIALALVAIGGLCAYVIVRRKADDEA